MPRPIYATIHPCAIAHNLALAKHYAPNSFVWGVIKANAYGHGIERIFSGLHHADGLAMLDFAEASRVRALGWTKPILMLEGCFDADDVATCARLHLTPMLHSPEQLQLHQDYPAPLGVHVKLNSGMNRLGFPLQAIPSLQLLRLSHLTVQMWVTHFANADAIDGVAAPLTEFETALNTVFASHPTLRAPLSTSNSAATLSQPNTHHAAVRSGIMLYGSSPFSFNNFNNFNNNKNAIALNLRPAMCLNSAIIAVQTVLAGQSIGYGSWFTAPVDLRIGIVACGYADGYPRHAPTGTPIAVAGIVTRTLGRVSMDMLAVDLSTIPHAKVGSPVELWGNNVSVDAVAHAAGTIGYELLCALAARVPVHTLDT